MARMLVTGAAGFIGSQLSERLIEIGHSVIGVDCFSDHYARELKEMNLSELEGASAFDFVSSDIARGSLCEMLDGIDVVFHLAARPGVRDSWVDFDDYVEANIIGSRSVFDAAVATGTRVVYASSSSVYGDAASLPVSEAHPLRAISPYGASKVMTEVLAGAYAASYGLNAVGLRYFTVYGPRQRPDMGLARFIEALIGGRPISLYGDGMQKRDMTYVGDVVEATIAAAEKGASRRVYNVASGSPRALLDILSELGDSLALPLRLAHEAPKAGDVRDTWGDIALATADLGWTPRVPLAEGLARQVEEAERRRPTLVAQSRRAGVASV